MGGMVVVSMYPASRIVIKPINCEYTSILQMLCDIGTSLCVYKTYFK